MDFLNEAVRSPLIWIFLAIVGFFFFYLVVMPMINGLISRAKIFGLRATIRRYRDYLRYVFFSEDTRHPVVAFLSKREVYDYSRIATGITPVTPETRETIGRFMNGGQLKAMILITRCNKFLKSTRFSFLEMLHPLFGYRFQMYLKEGGHLLGKPHSQYLSLRKLASWTKSYTQGVLDASMQLEAKKAWEGGVEEELDQSIKEVQEITGIGLKPIVGKRSTESHTLLKTQLLEPAQKAQRFAAEENFLASMWWQRRFFKKAESPARLAIKLIKAQAILSGARKKQITADKLAKELDTARSQLLELAEEFDDIKSTLGGFRKDFFSAVGEYLGKPKYDELRERVTFYLNVLAWDTAEVHRQEPKIDIGSLASDEAIYFEEQRYLAAFEERGFINDIPVTHQLVEHIQEMLKPIERRSELERRIERLLSEVEKINDNLKEHLAYMKRIVSEEYQFLEEQQERATRLAEERAKGPSEAEKRREKARKALESIINLIVETEEESELDFGVDGNDPRLVELKEFVAAETGDPSFKEGE